jgi:hypothetical protein
MDARADVEFLFGLMRASYPAYDYFGGEQSFGRARASVLGAIDAASAPVGPRFLAGELRRALSFVSDNHLEIGWLDVDFDQTYLLSDGRDDWFRDERGFYRVREGRKEYMVSADGVDAERALKLSIAEDGRLCYRLAVEHGRKNVRVTIEFDVGDSTESETRYLYHGPAYEDGDAYERWVSGGVPVHRLRSMEGQSADSMSRFIDEGPQEGDSGAAIIDLRGNGGGFTDGIAEWFRRFAGQEPQGNATTAFLRSLTARSIRELQEDPGSPIELSGARQWSELYVDDPSPFETPLLFVLMDERTASSAEAVVEWLHPARTVILVGESTGGVFLVGGNSRFRLPSSGVPIRFGSNLTASPSAMEGVGFMPDLALPSIPRIDMRERVIAMISRYGADAIREALIQRE